MFNFSLRNHMRSKVMPLTLTNHLNREVIFSTAINHLSEEGVPSTLRGMLSTSKEYPLFQELIKQKKYPKI